MKERVPVWASAIYSKDSFSDAVTSSKEMHQASASDENKLASLEEKRTIPASDSGNWLTELMLDRHPEGLGFFGGLPDWTLD
jgi:hypothetical protein